MLDKLSLREKISIALLLLVLAWAASIVFDLRDPMRNYTKYPRYCKIDTDCQVVLDTLTNACLSVNTLHKDKYDMDTQCRRRISKCISHLCVAP